MWKSDLKAGGDHAIFLVLEVKNFTKIEEMRLFLFTFLVLFFIVSLAENPIYTIYIYIYIYNIYIYI